MTEVGEPGSAPSPGRWRLGVRACFDGVRLVEGDVLLEAGRVIALGVQPPAGDLLAAPGFIDLQVNGFAGVDLLGASVEGYRRVSRALLATGVTAFQPTLVSAPVEVAEAALRVVGVAASGVRRGARVLPAHLEGPFLSPRWPGAHRPEHLRRPERVILERLLAAGPVGEVTLAPELPGAGELVGVLAEAGVTVAVGHSDASAEQAAAAFERGASVLVHAFNAHRRLMARDPGPAGAALARDDVWVHLIADGVHVAPEICALVDRAVGAHLFVATDAMTAAGLGEGDYRFGDQQVHVEGGRATLEDGRLAGSVATLDACVRQLIAARVPLVSALAAATSRPASVLGDDRLGHLRPGSPADLVLLDRALVPTATYLAGELVAGGAPVGGPSVGAVGGEAGGAGGDRHG